MNDWDGDDRLGAELRRLFGDERLDMNPRADSGKAIVAGAQRRRKRRAAMATGGGTLAVLALVGGTLAVSTLRGGDEPANVPPAAMPQTSPTTSQALSSPSSSVDATQSEAEEPGPSGSAEPPDAPASPPESSWSSASSSPPSMGTKFVDPTLGPEGYRELSLGMSFGDANSTGLISTTRMMPPSSGTPCSTYRVSDGTDAVSDVTISEANGIVRFRAAEAKTADGIGAGSSLEQLRSTYPDLTTESSGYSASAGANARYSFAVTDETVTDLQLVAVSSDC
ncbi:hypothetical protein [Prauserella cavernicola]|uniref:Uncharacterized protein n=1 Tax=Prauserella cavernicola TaxID=2800127 RepID=A0A934V5B3_9PSEU|nr:hypothetical protein [Prauserella cavernicola]MBK1784423.1 hypothetical protein [Prauserella cavernicola]